MRGMFFAGPWLCLGKRSLAQRFDPRVRFDPSKQPHTSTETRGPIFTRSQVVAGIVVRAEVQRLRLITS